MRLPLPTDITLDAVPIGLHRWLDPEQRTITAPGDDLLAVLGHLLAWNRASEVDLSGLEVGMPSLEQAYLTLTEPATSERP